MFEMLISTVCKSNNEHEAGGHVVDALVICTHTHTHGRSTRRVHRAHIRRVSRVCSVVNFVNELQMWHAASPDGT